MKKIYYVILLTFLARLYHINFTVSGWHAWRQSDTAAIARNFFRNGFNIFYPQIDWSANSTRYVESEFHIYPFIVSLIYCVSGVNDMYGRIVSVIFSLFTVYGLYLFVRKIINEEVALWSSFIYAILPLNIYYGRAFMPESAMLMCSIYSVYFFSEWIDKGNFKYYILSWLFTTLAILIKLPTLYIGLPMLYLALQKYRLQVFKNIKMWVFFLLVIIPVFLWYYHAHQLYLNNGATFGIWSYGYSKWGMFDQLLDVSFYHKVFLMDLAERHFTFPGFILFLIGLFIKRDYLREKIFDYWLIAVIIYFFIVTEGTRVHEYYQLPFLLPASVFIGKTCNKYLPINNIGKIFKSFNYKTLFVSLCVVLIFILSYLRLANFMKSEQWDSALFKISHDVKTISGTSDLIITVSNGDPVYLYQCDRKGWTAAPEQLDSNLLIKRTEQGATWLVGEKNKFQSQTSKENLTNIFKNYKIIRDESDYFIVNLSK